MKKNDGENKVLLLSCSTGEGHNSAAKALAEELDRRGVEYEIADPVRFKSERTQKLVSACYNGIIKRAPSVFGAIYKVGALYDSSGLLSPIYLANAAYAPNMYKYIEENGFTAVISTHLYGMEALTAIRRRLGKYVPSYGVLTDYTTIPFLGDVSLDGCFIPHPELKDAVAACGIDGSVIYPTGIPVSPRFNELPDKQTARKMLGISTENKVLCVMSGGIGGGNVTGLCDELMNTVDDSTQIFVLTGKNKELKQKLTERYGIGANGGECLVAVSFTREVSLYMRAADVLLSKPGGLSSTEAAAAGVPLIHINAIPGCETENARFFAAHGMALTAQENAEAARLSAELLQDTGKARRITAAQKSVINAFAARDIAEKILNR